LQQVVIPPDLPDSLVPGDEEGTARALSALACAPDHRACVGEAVRLRTKAQRFFAANRRRLVDDCRERWADQKDGARPQGCTHAAASGDYPRWRACIDQRRPRVPAFPIGDLRPVMDGWLMVQDQRMPAAGGNGCTRTLAAHLASGGAHVVQSCPGRAADSTAGTVPLPLLRETTWMLLLAEHVGWKQVKAHRVAVPRGLLVRWPVGRPGPGVTGCGSAPAAHVQAVGWRWWREGAPAAGDSFPAATPHPGRARAAQLLDRLGRAFRPGPAAPPLPAPVARLAGTPLF
jgi:hypothetical protein